MRLTELEKLSSDLNTTLTELGDILNDTNFSKGMRVNKAVSVKAKLGALYNALSEGCKQERMRRHVDGVLPLSVLASKNNIRYQLTGLEGLCVIKEVHTAPPEGGELVLTYQVYYAPAAGQDVEQFSSEDHSLSDVIVKVLINLCNCGVITMEELEAEYTNSVLLIRIKAGIKTHE